MREGTKRPLKTALTLLPAIVVAGTVVSLFFLESGGPSGARPVAVEAPKGAGTAARGPAAPNSTPSAAPQAPGLPLEAFRVLSWNLRDCAATDGKTGERLAFHDSIAQVLARLRPDLAAFQEIQRDEEKGGDIALLQVALAKAGWAMPYQTTVESGGPDDLALFSRSPILGAEAVLGPGADAPWPRPGLRARVEVQGEPLDVLVFHFKAMSDQRSEAERKAQAKAAATLVRQGMADGSLSSYIVVAGDLNTTNPGDRGAATSTLGLLELRDDADTSDDFSDPIEDLRPQVPTFADSRHHSVLDHLLLSPAATKALKRGSAIVFVDLPPASPLPVSDHRPVLLELEFAEKR